MTTQREIHINHGELRTRLDRLRQLEAPAAIHAELTDLLPFLERHFAAEESPDSFFDMIRANAPGETEAVGELEQQHEQFLESIELLIARAKVGESKLGPDISQLIRGLEAHEAIEHRLLKIGLHERYADV